MTTIVLETPIFADIQSCFDVARNIDVHVLSTKGTNEKAIAGRISGFAELDDTITWEATHFGIKQQLTSKITQFNAPIFFEDTMQKGAFKSMRHEHHFENLGEVTKMVDIFKYEVPYSIFGAIFNKLILKRYMTNFLSNRNQVIKEFAESNSKN